MSSVSFNCPKCKKSYINEKRFKTHIENCKSDREVIDLSSFGNPVDRSHESRHSSRVSQSISDYSSREAHPREKSNDQLRMEIEVEKYKKMVKKIGTEMTELKTNAGERIDRLQKQSNLFEQRVEQLSIELASATRDRDRAIQEKNEMSAKHLIESNSINEIKQRWLYEKIGLDSEIKKQGSHIETVEIELTTIRNDYQRVRIELINLQSKLKTDLEAKDAECQFEANRLKEKFENQLVNIELKHRRELLEISNQHEGRRRDIESEIARKIGEINFLKHGEREFKDAIQAIENAHSRELNELKESHANTIERLNLDHRTAIMNLELACNVKIHEIRELCEERVKVSGFEITFLKTKIGKLEQDVIHDESNVIELHKQNDHCGTVITEQLALIHQLTSELDNSKNKIAYIDAMRIRLENEKKEALQAVEETKEEVRQLSVKNQCLIQSSIDALNNTQNVHEQTRNNLMKLISVKDTSSVKSHGELECKLKEFAVKYEGTETARRMLASLADETKLRLVQSQNELSTCKNLCDHLRTQLKTVENDVELKNGAIQALTTENKNNHLQIVELRGAIESLRSEIETSSTALKQHYATELGKKDDEIRGLVVEIQRLNNIDIIYEKTRDALQQHIVEAELTSKGNSDKNRAFEKRCEELLAITNREKNVLIDEVKRLELIINGLRDERDRAVVEKQQSETDDEVDHLRGTITMKDLLIDSWEKKYEAGREEVLKSSASFKSAMETIKLEKEKLERDKAEFERVRVIPLNIDKAMKKSRDDAFNVIREERVRREKAEAELEIEKARATEIKEMYEKLLIATDRVSKV